MRPKFLNGMRKGYIIFKLRPLGLEEAIRDLLLIK